MQRCIAPLQAMTATAIAPPADPRAAPAERAQAGSDAVLGPGHGHRVDLLGPVEIVRWSGDAGLAHDGPDKRARGAAPRYTVLLQARGASRISHYGMIAALGEGDLILINNAAPHGLLLTERSDLIALQMPLRQLRTYLPSPEQYCGRPLRHAEGISESAAKLILGICAQLEEGLDDAFRGRIARNLLDLLATAFALGLEGAFAASPVICDRNARVRLYIEQTLRDPELCPSSIAAGLRLSPRYLRAIFAASKGLGLYPAPATGGMRARTAQSAAPESLHHRHRLWLGFQQRAPFRAQLPRAFRHDPARLSPPRHCRGRRRACLTDPCVQGSVPNWTSRPVRLGTGKPDTDALDRRAGGPRSVNESRPIALVNVGTVRFGTDAALQCAPDFAARGLKSAFLVTGAPTRGLAAPLTAACAEKGIAVTIFDGIAGEPTLTEFAAAMARRAGLQGRLRDRPGRRRARWTSPSSSRRCSTAPRASTR